METRNKETLKQKQVTISIFMVICVILTKRPGKIRRGGEGIFTPSLVSLLSLRLQ